MITKWLQINIQLHSIYIAITLPFFHDLSCARLCCFIQGVAALPQDRSTSPGPGLDPESDSQPELLEPEAASHQAVAHIRPIWIADIFCDVSDSDSTSMHVFPDFGRV